MGAEKRVLEAIALTRVALKRALIDPKALVQMTAWDVEPDAIENTVTKILEYLEKAAPEKPEEAEG